MSGMFVPVVRIGGFTAFFALLIAAVVWGAFWYIATMVIAAVFLVQLTRPSVRREIAKGWRGEPPYGR